MTRTVGLDFGTTNSALAVRDQDAPPQLASFDASPTFRSILFFDADEHGPNTAARPAAGAAAIERYLESGGNGRLLLSLKSFLADRTFSATDIFGRRFTLEELVSLILLPMRRAAEQQFGDLGRRAVVGRPVRFSGAGNEADEERALRRLRTALALAGGRMSYSSTSRSPPPIITAPVLPASSFSWLATSAAAPAISA
jgi:hypothetical chaperone protein